MVTCSLPFSPESPLLSVEVALAASDMVVYGEQGGLHIKLKSMPDVLCLPYQHTFRRRDNTTDWSRLPACLLFFIPPTTAASNVSES